MIRPDEPSLDEPVRRKPADVSPVPDLGRVALVVALQPGESLAPLRRRKDVSAQERLSLPHLRSECEPPCLEVMARGEVIREHKQALDPPVSAAPGDSARYDIEV